MSFTVDRLYRVPLRVLDSGRPIGFVVIGSRGSTLNQLSSRLSADDITRITQFANTVGNVGADKHESTIGDVREQILNECLARTKHFDIQNPLAPTDKPLSDDVTAANALPDVALNFKDDADDVEAEADTDTDADKLSHARVPTPAAAHSGRSIISKTRGSGDDSDDDSSDSDDDADAADIALSRSASAATSQSRRRSIHETLPVRDLTVSLSVCVSRIPRRYHRRRRCALSSQRFGVNAIDVSSVIEQ